ncbi:MAG: PEP-CTERM sorting domain-containing protein [Anaerolineales bacterium]|nr:PEP-CTERM sorting domain-containing protein [Anaerolineales bacterium]
MMTTKKTLLATALLAALGVSTQAHAVLFDPDGVGGTGAKNIDTFDWNFTSFLALNGQQAIANWVASNGACLDASCQFDVLTHAALSSASLDGDLVPLGIAGEITLIMRFTETVTSVGTNSETHPENTASFATVPGSGWVEIYYDSVADSSALNGAGFNDGQLILSGTLVGDSSGSFTVDLNQSNGSNQIVRLDQLGTDNYTSDTTDPQDIQQSTITGHGDQNNLAFQNLVTDPNFFLTPLAAFGIQFANISINLPYISTNPSDCFTAAGAGAGAVGTTPGVPAGSCNFSHVLGPMSSQTDPGANGIVPDIGAVNGLLTLDQSFGPDFIAQTDYNSPLVAAVPEPGSIALLGLGLGALGMVSRRRRLDK